MSQMSAGSRTDVGAYHRDDNEATEKHLGDLSGQFSLMDHRTASEVRRCLACLCVPGTFPPALHNNSCFTAGNVPSVQPHGPPHSTRGAPPQGRQLKVMVWRQCGLESSNTCCLWRFFAATFFQLCKVYRVAYIMYVMASQHAHCRLPDLLHTAVAGGEGPDGQGLSLSACSPCTTHSTCLMSKLSLLLSV
jgi:hypothetical protein